MGRRPAVTAFLLGTLFVALYLATASADLRHNGDTLLRYQTTQSLVEQHHIWIAHPVSEDIRVVPGRGGHLYAFYAPGQAVLMAPLYVLGKAVAHHLNLSYDLTTRYATRSLDLLLGAGIVIILFFTALSLGYSLVVSALLSLIFGLATPAWPDAQSGLEQTQVDFFLLLAAFAAWQSLRWDRRRALWLVLAGTSAGLTVLTRYDALLFVPLVGLFPILVRYVRVGWRAAMTDGLVYVLSTVPWGLALLAWNWLRFGSLLHTGLQERTFGEPPLIGLAGLLISPGKGLIWYMPLVLVLPFVARSYYRRAGPFALFSVALVGAPLLLYANILYWHGDPAWGPRYLYAALPYLVLPLGEALTSWRRLSLPSQAAFSALVGIGLLLSVSAVSVTQWRFWYRLQALEQRTVNASAWTGEPFHWGGQRYHYYWVPRESPILIQVDDLYQVLRLDVLGDRRFEFRAQPDPFTSNPADNYPVNTLNFWWADVRHPLLNRTALYLLAALLGLSALVSAAALFFVLRKTTEEFEPAARERGGRASQRLAHAATENPPP
jgi:Dolichyl-phosphate-mannose-protein mannosyltransferase